jgi:Flp pilus assembly protein TadG
MTQLPRQPRRLRQARLGAHIVEMALVLPILIMVVFGIIEFARANQIRQAVKQAAYEGARVGITMDASVANVQTQANSVLSSVGITGSTVTVSPNPLTSTTAFVTVTVSASATANGWFMKYFTPGQAITAAVTLESENSGISYVGGS